MEHSTSEVVLIARHEKFPVNCLKTCITIKWLQNKTKWCKKKHQPSIDIFKNRLKIDT